MDNKINLTSSDTNSSFSLTTSTTSLEELFFNRKESFLSSSPVIRSDKDKDLEEEKKIPEKNNSYLKGRSIYPNNLPSPPISYLAATTANQRQMYRITIDDWLKNHLYLHSLNTSVNPVIALGYEKYVNADELTRKLLQKLSHNEKWKKLEPAVAESYTQKVKQALDKFFQKEKSYFINNHDLIGVFSELKQLPENENIDDQRILENSIQALRAIIDKNKVWVNKKELNKRLSNFLSFPFLSPLNSLLKNHSYHVKLDDIPSKKFHRLFMKTINEEFLSEECLKKILIDLKHQYAFFSDLHPGYGAIFKAGSESYLEKLPVYLAQVLGLQKVVLDGNITTLPNAQCLFKPEKNKASIFFNNPVGNLQSYIKQGVSPSHLDEMISKDPIKATDIKGRISLQSYQEGFLFSVISKQADLHSANAFLIPHKNNYIFKLFDIGRCLTPEGYETRDKKTKFPLRLFFAGMKPWVDMPLTDESISLIKSWNIKEIREQFIEDDLLEINKNQLLNNLKKLLCDFQEIPKSDKTEMRKTLDLIRVKEKELDQFLKTHISPSSLNGVLKRITDLQKLLSERERYFLPPPPPILCLEKLFPKEMRFFPLFEKVYGDSAGYALNARLEEVIEEGLQKGKLSQEEKEKWVKEIDALKNDPDFVHIPFPWGCYTQDEQGNLRLD